MPNNYFGTDGIRGVFGSSPIEPVFMQKLGFVLGTLFQEHTTTVLIAKDTRVSCDCLESSLLSGLLLTGLNVSLVGVLPISALVFLANTFNYPLAIMITASHNVHTDNGVKFFFNGSKLTDSWQTTIECHLDESNINYAQSRCGQVTPYLYLYKSYIQFCCSSVIFSEKCSIKVALDCANGATYLLAPIIFKYYGIEVIPINCVPNGTNINQNCGSQYLKSLSYAICEHNCHLGIAFDGDGDRVIIMDQHLNIYNGDKILFILVQLYQQVLQIDIGDIVVGSITSSLSLEKSIKQFGCKLLRADVGDRNILAKMIEVNAILGAEPSGHIICRDKHATADGIIIALHIVLAFINKGDLVSYFDSWYDYYQVNKNISYKKGNSSFNEQTILFIKAIEEKLSTSGRVIVRYSGTEPVIRVIVESDSLTLSNTYANLIEQHLLNV